MMHLALYEAGQLKAMCGAPAPAHELTSSLTDCECPYCRAEDDITFALFLVKSKVIRKLLPKRN